MTSRRPERPDPAADRIDEVEATRVFVLIGLALFSGMIVGWLLLGVVGVAELPSHRRPLTGWTLAVVVGAVLLKFGTWLVVALHGLWRAWRGPRFAVDQHGIWLSDGGWTLLRWSDLAGVGIGEQSASGERWSGDVPRGTRVELYPATPEADRWFEIHERVLRRFVGPPPYPQLPLARYLLRALTDEDHRDFAWAVAHRRPDLWIGRHPRHNPAVEVIPD